MNIKKGIVYVFVANLISLVISLVTGFVLPKLLSIDSYSNIKLFQLYITYIGILHLGYSDGMYLKYGGKTVDKIDKKELFDEFNTFKLFQVIVTIICIICSLIINNHILLFCSIVILPINIGNYLKNLYQATGKFDLYSRYMNINTIMIFMVNMFILFIMKSDNYYFFIIGYVIAYFIYWTFIEIQTNKLFSYNKIRFDKKYLLLDIKNGFLLMIGNFCNVIFTTIDRVFVKNILGIIKFAFYSFAVSIENLLNTFIIPISTVMYNYFCIHKEEENVMNIKQVIMIFSSAIVLSVFPSIFIIENFIDKYVDSIVVLSLLFASQFIVIIIRTVHINIFKAEKKQKLYFTIMMIVIMISIILNIVFYQILGSMEAFAIATLLTNIIWFVLNEITLRRYKSLFKDYIFFFLELVFFLITSIYFNCILGMFIYLMVTIISILIFERKAFNIFIEEFKKILDKKKLKLHREG